MNIHSPDELVKEFFGRKDSIERLMRRKTKLIFHCEFSLKRGPQMTAKLRELD